MYFLSIRLRCLATLPCWLCALLIDREQGPPDKRTAAADKKRKKENAKLDFEILREASRIWNKFCCLWRLSWTNLGQIIWLFQQDFARSVKTSQFRDYKAYNFHKPCLVKSVDWVRRFASELSLNWIAKGGLWSEASTGRLGIETKMKTRIPTRVSYVWEATLIYLVRDKMP